MVVSKRFPRNLLKAMRNPAGIPTTLAINVDVELTKRETRTISRRSAPRDQISSNKAPYLR
jgi:hypothetical protein